MRGAAPEGTNQKPATRKIPKIDDRGSEATLEIDWHPNP